MAKSKQQKEKEIKKLIDKFKESKSAVLSSIEGLNVKDTEALRKNLTQGKGELQVVKKTLLKKAMADLKCDGLDYASFKGTIGMAFGPDEVMAAKTIKTFSKTHEKVSLLAGFLEGKYLSLAEVEALAVLPNRDEMIARTIATIKAPVSGFVNVLAGNLRSLLNVLKAIGDNKA